jgi:hypothetical protein
MTRSTRLVAALLTPLVASALLALSGSVQAQDKKADPTGTWSWSMPGRDGGEARKITLKLKTEGDKISGKLISPGRQGGDPMETEISDGKLKGDEVAFSVTRERQGNKYTQKYQGKIAGDTIKGKIQFDRNGETQSRDWEAKRETEKK